MKLSQLLQALTDIQNRHGDLDVVTRDPDSGAVRPVWLPDNTFVMYCVRDPETKEEVCIDVGICHTEQEKQLINQPDTKLKLVF